MAIMNTPESLTVDESQAGRTLADMARRVRPGLSWSDARALIDGRRVGLNGEVCRDPARRVKLGDTVALHAHPPRPTAAETADEITIRHLDPHVVVVEKPAGINTVRHPAERDWNEDRRLLAPTLEDLTQRAIGLQLGRKPRDLMRLRVVHRLDKATSGLVVFARTAEAERDMGGQFFAHSVGRMYLALVRGKRGAGTIASWLVPDRGDGRRGSGPEGQGKRAVTHVEVERALPRHTLLRCKLETGRTHQIRIHLSESGHPVLGDLVYDPVYADGGTDPDRPSRLMLHAVELGFAHPHTQENLHWEMPPPAEYMRFMESMG